MIKAATVDHKVQAAALYLHLCTLDRLEEGNLGMREASSEVSLDE